jgi:ElaB/YqjD/DUF883 family membrane-anchored ribosome-binding protein
MAQGTPYSSETSNAVNDLRDKTSDKFDKVSDSMEGAMKSMQDRGREVGDNVQQVAGNFKSAVDSSVRDQPMATLALAAAVGFVLGAIWKS